MGLIQHHLSYTTNRREQRIVYFYPLVSFRQHFLFVCLFLYPEIEDNNTPNVLYCIVLSCLISLVSTCLKPWRFSAASGDEWCDSDRIRIPSDPMDGFS